VAAYPDPIADQVYFCGFASESSFGASSYLIVRQGGNVLVDSPRFVRPLADRIYQMGGIRYIFLTHRDDVADHRQWADEFGAEHLMHKDDAGRLRSAVEHLIEGPDAVAFQPDLLVIPTPGHTRGHMVLLHQQFLFTGDHLWWSDNFHSLHASRGVCWYSWEEQTKSMQKLLDYRFEWVLPGHGRRAHADAEQMQMYLRECLSRM
jgi:glyoxylase-like metal-dependent hydrolase (beta-lactamase superfamily II)